MKANRGRSCSTKNTKVPQGQLTLLQCGFLKLLEKGTETFEDVTGASDDESVDDKSVVQTSKGSSEIGCLPKPQEHCSVSGHQITSLLPLGKEKDFGKKYEDQCVSDEAVVVMESEDSSAENDIIFPSQFPANQKSVKRCKEVTECLAIEKSSPHAHLQKHSTSEWSVTLPRSVSPFSTMKSFEHIQKNTFWREGSDMSDESDDIEILPQSGPRKQNATSLVKQKRFHNKEISNCSRSVLPAESQNIEEFSSPEDSVPVRKAETPKQRLKSDRRRIHFESKFPSSLKCGSLTLRKRSNSNMHQNSPSMQRLASQAEKMGSLDQLLGNYKYITKYCSKKNSTQKLNVIGSETCNFLDLVDFLFFLCETSASQRS